MHEYEKPVYFKRDVFFTRLVVDKVRVDIGGAVVDYTVYYAGTSKYDFYNMSFMNISISFNISLNYF